MGRRVAEDPLFFQNAAAAGALAAQMLATNVRSATLDSQ